METLVTADNAEKGERRQLSTAFWWGMKERQGSVLKTKLLLVPAKAGGGGETCIRYILGQGKT